MSYYKPGAWNAICQACGFERKSDELRKRWDGYYVCSDTCWEPRHSLDFVRSRPERVGVRFSRPERAIIFVGVGVATEALADIGEADYAEVLE